MGTYFSSQRAQRRLGAVVIVASLLLAVIIGAFGATGAAHAATSDPVVTVKAVTATATPGGTLLYKITVDNDNTDSADLKRTDVTFRYDPNTLTLVNSQFNGSNDFVSRVETNKATVQFGSIDSDETRSATLVFQVNPNASVGAPIQADVTYSWTSATSTGGSGFVVENVTVASATVATAASITPTSAASGTRFQIAANGFGSEEQVVTWLNTPSNGARNVGLSGKTTTSGEIALGYDSAGLAAGAYSLVLHGVDSRREYMVAFVITQ